MSSSLLNWVNKRSKSNDECDNSANKKLCVESEHTSSNKESNKNMELHETSDLPECWNKGQYENFKTLNKWLVVKNKTLGCLICKNITNLGLSVVDNQQTLARLFYNFEWKVKRNLNVLFEKKNI